jgi:hypothetical protein
VGLELGPLRNASLPSAGREQGFGTLCISVNMVPVTSLEDVVRCDLQPAIRVPIVDGA